MHQSSISSLHTIVETETRSHLNLITATPPRSSARELQNIGIPYQQTLFHPPPFSHSNVLSVDFHSYCIFVTLPLVITIINHM